MNIAQRSPWDEYWNQGGFLKAPRGQMAGGFRLPGAAPQGQTVMDHELAIGDKMAEFKRRPTPPRPEQFDMAAALNAMGGPPQRAALPQRPGPDRSTGSVLGQALAGASDVFGAAAGQRTGNLDRMQALQRQQADTQYQDQLRQAAVAHENQNQGWNFQLQKLGAQQAASDRTQQNYGQDVGIQMSEDNALAGDLQRRMDNIRRGQMDTKEESRYADLQGRLTRGENLEASRYADRKPMMDQAFEAAKAEEAHRAALRPGEIKLTDWNVNKITGQGTQNGQIPPDAQSYYRSSMAGKDPAAWLAEVEKQIAADPKLQNYAAQTAHLNYVRSLAQGATGNARGLAGGEGLLGLGIKPESLYTIPGFVDMHVGPYGQRAMRDTAHAALPGEDADRFFDALFGLERSKADLLRDMEAHKKKTGWRGWNSQNPPPE